MKNVLYQLVLATGLAFGLLSFQANAVLMSSSGSWSNPQGTAAQVNGLSTNTISWGCETWSCANNGGNQSSWTFAGVLGGDIATDGSKFEIGMFTHVNNPIYKYNFLGADLNLGLYIGGALSTLSFSFGHLETLNSLNPCPGGGSNPCADKVIIPTVASSDTITIGGMVYEMTIEGFVQSQGFVNTLWTDEKTTNTAKIFGKLAKVPEPSVIALFAIGILGLGFVRRLTHN